MKHHSQQIAWALLLLMTCTGSMAHAASGLTTNQQLTTNRYLASDNGKFLFYLQGDGNLVLRDWATRKSLWSSATHGDGSGDSAGGSGLIQHIGTTEVWDRNGQGVQIDRPSGTRSGDLMVLVLHRTDDYLPFEVSGWQRGAECYKEDNGYQCLTVPDCTSKSVSFCNRFQGKYTGRLLTF